MHLKKIVYFSVIGLIISVLILLIINSAYKNKMLQRDVITLLNTSSSIYELLEYFEGDPSILSSKDFSTIPDSVLVYIFDYKLESFLKPMPNEEILLILETNAKTGRILEYSIDRD